MIAPMREILQDLLAHGAWADAEHWRALDVQPGALADRAACERLHHIHLVQRAFLSLAKGEAPRITSLTDYPTMAALKDAVVSTHQQLASVLAEITPARLAEVIQVPWFKDPPCHLTVGQALHQAAMHSHYHRGQNATRLRELGGKPPLTDLIVWYWKGRPGPAWA